jgi:succinate dehydrogenase/fumarate reductase-like Fe-S protein
MLKRVFSPITLCVCCALLLVACGSSNTNNTATTPNANAARTTTTTTTTNTATTNAATTTTASADKVGVPECDDYLAKYDACVTSKVPAAARAQYEASLTQMRKSWHEAAASPQGRAGLAQACKTATESARTSLKAYGCDF